jgi:hypothetical protein
MNAAFVRYHFIHLMDAHTKRLCERLRRRRQHLFAHLLSTTASEAPDRVLEAFRVVSDACLLWDKRQVQDILLCAWHEGLLPITPQEYIETGAGRFGRGFRGSGAPPAGAGGAGGAAAAAAAIAAAIAESDAIYSSSFNAGFCDDKGAIVRPLDAIVCALTLLRLNG